MTSLIQIVEILFSIGIFLNALFFLPQIRKLYKQKQARDFSLLTFLGFNIIQIFTAWHGYIVEDYKLMWGTAANFVLCSVVTFLIILYRQKNK